MKIHYANRVQARCGKFLAECHSIVITQATDKVTCKPCLRSIKTAMKEK